MRTQDRLKQEFEIRSNHNFNEIASNSNHIGSMPSETRIRKPILLGSKDGGSALPPVKPSFIKMLPTILYTILVQWQNLYFVGVALFLMFRYCGTEVGPLIVQIGFLIGYLLVQLSARYLTCKAYSQCPYHGQQYQVLGDRGWELKVYQNLTVGQLIRIKKRQRIPVCMLPLGVQSGNDYLYLDTFPINKQQQVTVVRIIPQIMDALTDTHSMLSQDKSYSFVYMFFSPMGSIFQGHILLNNQENQRISVTNCNTIPKGTLITTEQYVIGMILYSMEVDCQRDLKRVLLMRNGVDQVLIRHLLIIVGIMFAFGLLYFIISIILIYTVNLYQPTQQLACYFLNAMALITQAVHVTMYFYHALRRLTDAIGVSNKERILVRNYNKSLGEFGIVDTIVADDYLFLNRKLLELHQIIEDPQNSKHIRIQTILKVLQSSSRVRQTFPDHWLALYRRKTDRSRQQQFLVGKTGFRGNNSYSVCIRIEYTDYIITVSEKPRFLSLQSLNLSHQNILSETIRICKQKGQLMLMVQIAQINDFVSSDSMVLPEQQLKIHTLLTFKFRAAEQPTDFIKQIRGDYNIVIMSSRSWEILQTVFDWTGLKKQNEKALIFQQSCLSNFLEELKQHVHRMGSQEDDNDRILAFDSSLIAHLSRNEVRDSIKMLSKGSHYLIFFNCSQYQKQICATSLFKTFPRNLFFSNFMCDETICRRSFLSACLKIAPAAPYTTSLHLLLTKYASHSIAVTLHILYSHIFKNQVLIAASITTMFLIYKGGNYYTGIEYSQYLFILYNLFFSLLPILYYIIRRPRCYRQKKAPAYQPKDLFFQHIRGIVMGIIIALIAYAFVAEQFANNIFMVILISSIFAGNVYHLKNDKALSKVIQIIIIIVQCAIIITVLLLLAFFAPFLDEGIVQIEVNLDSSNVYFYIVTFVVQPIAILMLLFIFSFWSSLKQDTAQIIVQQPTMPTFLGPDLVAKPKRQSYKGKQMRFRDSESENIIDDLYIQNNQSQINIKFKAQKTNSSQSIEGIMSNEKFFQRDIDREYE